jgi:hypothetical protein
MTLFSVILSPLHHVILSSIHQVTRSVSFLQLRKNDDALGIDEVGVAGDEGEG